MYSTAADSGGRRVEDSVRPTSHQERFDRLLREYGTALVRLASSYARSSSDRDDLLQEMALGLWQALPGFREECSERTFLYRVAHNRAIAFLMRQRQPATMAQSNPADLADPSLDPETALAREQGQRRLGDAVRALPLMYRQVVTLMLEGLDYREISEVLGISESNVGARLTRARGLLRTMMGGGQ